MAGADPNERNGMDISVLLALRDKDHPVLLSELRSQHPTRQDTLVCSVFDLRDDALVTILEVGGDHLISLTPQGKSVLNRILSVPGNC
jgi:hypothetical protein